MTYGLEGTRKVRPYSLAVKVYIGVKMSFIFAVLMAAKSSSVK